MSHDPEAVALVAQFVADDVFGDDTEPTEPIRLHAVDLLDYLAAAGYTVTRDRYEPWCACGTRKGQRIDGSLSCMAGLGHGDDLPTMYRKIEGSTDGDDR